MIDINGFQFHKGTIKTAFQNAFALFVIHFNSIKVRLKPASQSPCPGSRQFQFHKGTIKTYDNEHIPYLVCRFQFHKGTIKTLMLVLIRLVILNFNSIKVRLKLLSHIRLLTHLFNFNSIKVRLKLAEVRKHEGWQLFQFHKGTIKTRFIYTNIKSLQDFNSIKVRLKHSFIA